MKLIFDIESETVQLSLDSFYLDFPSSTSQLVKRNQPRTLTQTDQTSTPFRETGDCREDVLLPPVTFDRDSNGKNTIVSTPHPTSVPKEDRKNPKMILPPSNLVLSFHLLPRPFIRKPDTIKFLIHNLPTSSLRCVGFTLVVPRHHLGL